MSEPLAEREEATPIEAHPAASGDTGVAEESADALPAAPPADSAEGPLHEPTTIAREGESATTRESDADVAASEGGGGVVTDETGPTGRIVSFAGQDGTADDGSAAYAADGAAAASPRDHAERDHLATTMSRPFTEDPSVVTSADDAGPATADETRPPLTEAELLRARLKEAAAFMQAQIEHATPSPVSRREKASAAADLALGMADLRHAEGLSQLQQQQQAKARSQRSLSRSANAQAVTPPPSSTTRGDSSSLLRPEGSTLAMRRKPSTTPQPTLSYDWNALGSPNDAMSPARRRHNRPGAAHSPHSPQAQSPGAVRRLPPLGSASSPPLTGSTSPGSVATGQTRLRAAELAFSTQSRVNVADDERLKYEVQLAHLLEHNTALATQHAAASAQYATWVAHKKELEEQTADHRAFAFQVRSELRKAQARCIEAERQSLAWHAKLRDLSLKLQRSRLKQTAEERHLSSELREARAQLRELRQTGKDEDDSFDAALASRTKRAAIIEDQLRLFDPAAYVERCELEELQAEMQHRTVVNLSAAPDAQSTSNHPTTKSKPGDKKDAKVTLEENGGSNQVDTSSSRFKTFHYTEGAEWASNNAPLPAPRSASPAEGPSITPPQTPPLGDGTGATPPSSSVKILDDIQAAKSAERAGRHHTHGSGGKHRSGAQNDADHDDVPDVTEHLVDVRDAVVPTGPPPPSMRLEKALGAYKSALDTQQRDKSGGVKAHQARLKKFLKGEF